MNNKLTIAGASASSIAAIIAMLNIFGFIPVWLDDFNDFKKSYYLAEIEKKQQYLHKVKIEIYAIEHNGGDLPPELIDKKLTIEDQIEKINKEIDLINQEKSLF